MNTRLKVWYSREITKLFDQENKEYSTFQTKIEKSMRVVWMRIIEFMEIAQLHEENAGVGPASGNNIQ